MEGGGTIFFSLFVFFKKKKIKINQGSPSVHISHALWSKMPKDEQSKKGFKILCFIKFKELVGKVVSRRSQNTNTYNYKGPLNHFTFSKAYQTNRKRKYNIEYQ